MRCHSVGSAKFVLEVILNGQHLILKSKHNRKHNQEGQLDASDELGTLIAWNSSMWIVDYFGHCQSIYAIEPVQQTAGKIFGNDESLIELLPDLPEPFSAILDVLSSEFLKLAFIRNLALFVKRTEKHIIKFMSGFLSQNWPSFEQRVHFARSLFLMLEDMHISSNGRIVMCDVHIDNFGYTKGGKLKILDADDIFVMEEASIKLSNTICDTDGDCTIGEYNDCHSHCDHEARTCSPVVAISNVRNICNVLLNLVFDDLTRDELTVFRTPYEKMGIFSNTDAISLDDELSRIRNIIELLHQIKS